MVPGLLSRGPCLQPITGITCNIFCNLLLSFEHCHFHQHHRQLKELFLEFWINVSFVDDVELC